jgi:hypothetical protein
MKLYELLCEGGKATEKSGTVRATKHDFDAALSFVSKNTGIEIQILKNQLLGSGRLTIMGKQKDSGDIDIAIDEKTVNRDDIISAMTKATGIDPYITGGNTYSFAVPTTADRKVQVDLMFVPNIKWAKYAYHSSENSKYKSAIRNELLHSALKFSMIPGQDVRLKDANGNDIARASRAYKLDKGVERIFKIAPERKDGKGRTKSLVRATPDDVRAVLNKEGVPAKFNPNSDLIQDPDKFVKLLFGDNVTAKETTSAEQLISLIKRTRKKDADKILADAVKGIKRLKFPVPDELKEYDA